MNYNHIGEDMASIEAAEKEACKIEGDMAEAVREAAYKSLHEPESEPVVVYLNGHELFVEFLGDDHVRSEVMTAKASLEERRDVLDLSGLGLLEVAFAFERQIRELERSA